MTRLDAEPVAGLYVHVPFCVQKCAYCAFYSEPAKGELIERYVGALILELERIAHDLRPRTIYFGGAPLRFWIRGNGRESCVRGIGLAWARQLNGR